MSKIVLDRETFKALASDTRLDILKALDGKQLNLTDLMRTTNLNKATLHEHLSKLTEVGLVKRQWREGHKWVYYRLTWKGESLLHPENSRIVVFFTVTFISLWLGILQLLTYARGTVTNMKYSVIDHTLLMEGNSIQDYSGMLGLYEKSFYSIPKIVERIPRMKEIFCRYMDLYIRQNKLEVFDGSHDQIYPALGDNMRLVLDQGNAQVVYQDPFNLYVGILFLSVFFIMLCVSIWRLWENKTQKV
ncbi:MAG: winged helix-turn-helix domain-containing protein [Candidatus Thermoplasmatota archaeon]